MTEVEQSTRQRAEDLGAPGDVQSTGGTWNEVRTEPTGQRRSRTRRRGRWTSTTYSNQCKRYSATRRRLDCGFNFGSVQPVNPIPSRSKIAGLRVGEYEICSTDYPWVFSPLRVVWTRGLHDSHVTGFFRMKKYLKSNKVIYAMVHRVGRIFGEIFI